MAERPVNIADSALESAIRSTLGKTGGEKLTVDDMAELMVLDLRGWDDPINDLSGLEFAVNLNELYLTPDGSVSDLSPLAGLNELRVLHLNGNAVEDISPLLRNLGLGEGDRISLSGNPLSRASIRAHIPTLQRRGVDVAFANAWFSNRRVISDNARLASSVYAADLDGDGDVDVLSSLERRRQSRLVRKPGSRKVLKRTSPFQGGRWCLLCSRCGSRRRRLRRCAVRVRQ